MICDILGIPTVILMLYHARQQGLHAGLGDFDVRQGPVDALNGEREPLIHLPLFLDDGIVRLVLLVLHRQHGRKTPQNLIVLPEMLCMVICHAHCPSHVLAA